MIPAKMIVTFEDGSSVDIDFYRKVEGTGWIAKAQDPMGAEGPGMDWPEALLNCFSAVESIRKGEVPAWVGQEIRRFKRSSNELVVSNPLDEGGGQGLAEREPPG